MRRGRERGGGDGSGSAAAGWDHWFRRPARPLLASLFCRKKSAVTAMPATPPSCREATERVLAKGRAAGPLACVPLFSPCTERSIASSPNLASVIASPLLGRPLRTVTAGQMYAKCYSWGVSANGSAKVSSWHRLQHTRCARLACLLVNHTVPLCIVGEERVSLSILWRRASPPLLPPVFSRRPHGVVMGNCG